MAHRYELDVRFYELDPYNHVNHSVYFQYFETARIALLAEVGYTMEGMAEDGMMILLTEVHTRFLEPAIAGDHLVVETEISGSTRVKTTWRQRLLRGDEVLVSQEIEAVITNLDGRPQRFPESMKEALTPFEA